MKQVLRIHGRGDLPVELAGALGSASGQAVQCAVALRRRRRAVGAAPVVNGAWMLPRTTWQEDSSNNRAKASSAGARPGFVLRFSSSSPESNESTVRLFQSVRSREYGEFAERCAAFLMKLTGESAAEKYTFAETGESEQDLKKLERWLAKIQVRDFSLMGADISQFALLAQCRHALRGFSQAVYKIEGVQESAADGIISLPRRPKSVTLRAQPPRSRHHSSRKQQQSSTQCKTMTVMQGNPRCATLRTLRGWETVQSSWTGG